MTQLRKKTITLPASKAVITVRESVPMDVIDAGAIYGELSYDRTNKRDLNRASKFADTLLRSTVEGLEDWNGLDAAKDGDLQTSFVVWQMLSASDLATWANALVEVNKAVDPKGTASPTKEAPSKPLTDTSSTNETPTFELENSVSS